MALNEKITCDICGVEKKESNHWILFEHLSGVTHIGFPVIRFYAWNNQYPSFKHLCGSACASKALNLCIEDWRGDMQTE